MSRLLQQSLKALGKTTQVLEMGESGHLMALSHGARVLGLHSHGSDENFYWTNPILEFAPSATKLFESNAWHNTGGDRTWVGPEVDVFYPGYPDVSRRVEPIQLEATGYELLQRPKQLGFMRRLSLYFARNYREVELELIKWIEPAVNPLRQDKRLAAAVSAAKYAGYTQRSTLSFIGESVRKTVPINLWNLCQFPHGGELIVPTYMPAEPEWPSGPISAEQLTCEPHALRFRADAAGEQAFSLAATVLTGRYGYLRRTGDAWSLVVRAFMASPSGTYADAPNAAVKSDSEKPGRCLHATSLLSAAGAYCEVGYHTPVGAQLEGQRSIADVAHVWAYRGPAEAIQTIGQALLGVDLRS